RARVARQRRLPDARRGLSRAASFPGHDPGPRAERIWRPFADLQLQARRAGNRRHRRRGNRIENDSSGYQRMRILLALAMLAWVILVNAPVLFAAGATSWEMN